VVFFSILNVTPSERLVLRQWHKPCFREARAANLKSTPLRLITPIGNYMKKFLLGLMAVAAVLLPLSQNAQAHWGYYHHYYGYRHAYWHRVWHHGYWYGGSWYPGYWYGGPVAVVVAPY
jgi:hypothetical protein